MTDIVTLEKIVEDAKSGLDECLKPGGRGNISFVPRIEDSEIRRRAIDESAKVLDRIILGAFKDQKVVEKNIDEVTREIKSRIIDIYQSKYKASKYPDLHKFNEDLYVEHSVNLLNIERRSDEVGPPPGWQGGADTPKKTAQEQSASEKGDQVLSNNTKLGLAVAAAGLAVGAALTGKDKPEEGKKKWTFMRVASTILLSTTAVALSLSALHGRGSWAERVSSSQRGPYRGI
jgi:hypothetical protein